LKSCGSQVVVIMMTPFAALLPYKADAFSPFRTSIEIKSDVDMVFIWSSEIIMPSTTYQPFL